MHAVRTMPALNKVFKALDHPHMWMIYFILSMYFFFFTVFAIRGIIMYNKILSEAEKQSVINTEHFNKKLLDKGFKSTWGTSPSVIDFFSAGLSH